MFSFRRLSRLAAAATAAAATLKGCSSEPALVSAAVQAGRVQLQWADRSVSQVLPLWLRHNCQCSLCVQPHSGQRRLAPTQLDPQAAVRSLAVDQAAQTLQVEWNSGSSHVSSVPVALLQTQPRVGAAPSCAASGAVDAQGVSRGSCSVVASGIAPHRHDYAQVMQSDHQLLSWLRDLAQHGAAVVEAAPLEPLVCQQLAGRISQAMPTIYGVDFDVEAMETPINIAYSTDGLDLHQDLAYYESTPGLQFLHCLAFDESVQGGYSTVMDAFALAERFRQQFPQDFAALSSIPATFQKIHFERERPACMVAQKTIVKTNKYGCIVDVVWSPPFEGPLVTDTVEEAAAFYQAYLRFAKLMNESSDLLVTLRLQPGQVLTFNNRRMLHGRTPFTLRPGSRRHLKGVYVNIDEFSSRLHALTRVLGYDPAELPRHIGNSQ